MTDGNDFMKSEFGHGEKPEDNAPKVVMTLTLTKEGQLQVSGMMIQDKIMALGLLELAKSTLEKHWAQSEIKLHKPNGIMGFVRNGRH